MKGAGFFFAPTGLETISFQAKLRRIYLIAMPVAEGSHTLEIDVRFPFDIDRIDRVLTFSRVARTCASNVISCQSYVIEWIHVVDMYSRL